jgi:hypothetical protein
MAAPGPQFAGQLGGVVVRDWSQEGSPRIAAGGLYLTTGLDVRRGQALVSVITEAVTRMAAMSDQEIVELVFADYPLWEADALYEAVRAARASLNPSGTLPSNTMALTQTVAR